MENGNARVKTKGWWESRTQFQRNLIVGIVVVGVLAGLIVPLCISSNSSQGEAPTNKTEEISVIIVGSGPAGIAAAAQLFQNNITNVVILEAENRIGGRIHSVQFGEAIADLGAEWCHGETGNVVYEMASKYNLLERDSHYNVAFYHSSQKYLDRAFVRQIYEIATAIFEKAQEGPGDETLGEFVLQRFNATIAENYGSNRKKVSLAYEILADFHLQVLEEDGAFSWFDISAFTDYKVPRGHPSLSWKGRGYKTILDLITKTYPNPEEQLPVYDSILLQKEVSKVYLEETGPKIVCADNTSYQADYVIWTPSLGVLKRHHSEVFEPELPAEKVKAIETLGIAAVMKVLLYYPQKWWPKHVDAFSFIWSKQDAQNILKEFPYGTKPQGRSWLLATSLIYVNRYNPNVLAAWFCGDAVPSIEKFQDDLIINGTMFLFRKFLGHQFRNLTRPQKIVREKWYTNDHFRGTYSYDTIASHADGISQRESLAAPLTTPDGKPQILFAGEATHPSYFSTVHGAIETGRREADRIINYHRN